MDPCARWLPGGAVQTTATTAQSSLLAPSLGGGDRTSANFGTFRTTTTVATSVAASELSRCDSSSIAPPVSETSYWDNESSVGSQYHPTASWHLTCVSEPKWGGGRGVSVVQLGQGKWPDDFIDAF